MGEHVTRREAAESLRVVLMTVDRMIADGRLKATKLHPGRGGKVLIERSSVDRLLSAGSSAPVPPTEGSCFAMHPCIEMRKTDVYGVREGVEVYIAYDPTGRIVARFRDKDDANAYVEWRNEALRVGRSVGSD